MYAITRYKLIFKSFVLWMAAGGDALSLYFRTFPLFIVQHVAAEVELK